MCFLTHGSAEVKSDIGLIFSNARDGTREWLNKSTVSARSSSTGCCFIMQMNYLVCRREYVIVSGIRWDWLLRWPAGVVVGSLLW